MVSAIKTQNLNTILGKVTDANGHPLANLKVEIYDVDMREWQALSDTFTNKEGKYELRWTHEQLRVFTNRNSELKKLKNINNIKKLTS